ncbi:MAG: hypothetical protein ACRYFZ_07285 [Janthinobacterium lividum]
MAVKTHLWDLLLDRPGLRATLDTLKGYTFPACARQVLCQQYALSEAEFAAVLQLHTTLIYRPGNSYTSLGRPRGRWLRDGMDLLLSLPKLRAVLDETRHCPLLEPPKLLRLCDRHKLLPAELVRVLNAHAELWART